MSLVGRINKFLIKRFNYALIERCNITYDTCDHCREKVDEHAVWFFKEHGYKLCFTCEKVLEIQLYKFLNPNDAGQGDILYLGGKKK